MTSPATSPPDSTSDTNLTPSIKTDTKLGINNNLRQQQTQTPIISFRSNPTSSTSTENESAFTPPIIQSKIEDTGDNLEEKSSSSSATMATINSHFFEGVEKLLEVILI